MVNSYQKGRRGENEFVAKVQFHGYDAERVSEPGFTGHDVTAFGGRTVEVKRRKELLQTYHKWSVNKHGTLISEEQIPLEMQVWAGDAQIVAVRENLGHWYLFMSVEEYLDLTEAPIAVPHEGPWWIWVTLDEFFDRIDDYNDQRTDL